MVLLLGVPLIGLALMVLGREASSQAREQAQAERCAACRLNWFVEQEEGLVEPAGIPRREVARRLETVSEPRSLLK